MKNNRVIDLGKIIEGKELGKSLEEIKIDLEMIEAKNKREMNDKAREVLTEFMNRRQTVGNEFEEWLEENMTENEDRTALWSYITEVFQHLLMPSIEDFSFDDGEVMDVMQQAKALGVALEGFHVSSMGTYLDLKLDK